MDGLDCNLDGCDCNCDGCDCDCNCDSCDCDCGDCFGCDCADGCDCFFGPGGGGCCTGDNVICCCFPYPASNNNNRVSNRTSTAPDCSIFCCCCLSPRERTYPPRREESRTYQPSESAEKRKRRRRGFCSRLWCCFTGNTSPNSSPSSSPPLPSKTQEVPPRNFPRDGRFPMQHEERLDMPSHDYYNGRWKYGDEMRMPSRESEREGRWISSLGDRDMPMPPRDYHDFQGRWSKPIAYGDYERRFKSKYFAS